MKKSQRKQSHKSPKYGDRSSNYNKAKENKSNRSEKTKRKK